MNSEMQIERQHLHAWNCSFGTRLCSRLDDSVANLQYLYTRLQITQCAQLRRVANLNSVTLARAPPDEAALKGLAIN